MTGIKPHVSTYSPERIKTIDLFPRTEHPHKNHYWPIPTDGENEKYIPDIKVSLSFHVETVVLLKIVV